MFLFGLGAVFTRAYAKSRNRGLLTAASSFFGLGVGVAFELLAKREGGVVIWGGLGLGLVAAVIADWLINRQTQWWPLLPGGALLTLAVGLWSAKPSEIEWLASAGLPIVVLLAAIMTYQWWLFAKHSTWVSQG